jgi:formylglycine-generating enzyme required for sulfatase activity
MRYNPASFKIETIDKDKLKGKDKEKEEDMLLNANNRNEEVITNINDNFPVENISWIDVMRYCKVLESITGHKYRLPTEAEWEYACRANSRTEYYFGNSIDETLCNFDFAYEFNVNQGKPITGKTKSVGECGKSNDFGLNDMHGNVSEWCEDSYHKDYLEAPNDGSAWISNDSIKVIRGGAWCSKSDACRSAHRGMLNKENKNNSIGFRLVLVAL